jgi:hypothetical protein
MSIGVVYATPESAVTIEPQISGEEDREPCEEGRRTREELRSVGSALADELII